MRAENGLVLRYSFLWKREYERGEEAGRKGRPVCVQLLFGPPGEASRCLLVPIMSQRPTDADAALAIPDLELRRVGLRGPAWVIVDQFNLEDDLARSPWIEDPKPLGRFSASFTIAVRRVMREAVAAKRYAMVPRDEPSKR